MGAQKTQRRVNRRSEPQTLEQSFQVVNLVWMAGLALVVAVWFALPRLVPRPTGGELASPDLVIPLLYVMALVDLGLGWWFKQRALTVQSGPREHEGPAVPGEVYTGPGVPASIAALSLLAVVMPVTAVVFAVIVWIGSGRLAAFSGLCALAAGGSLLVRPRLDEWQDAARLVSQDAYRRPRG